MKEARIGGEKSMTKTVDGIKQKGKNPELRERIGELARVRPRTDNDTATKGALRAYIMNVKAKVFEAEEVNNRCLIFQYRDQRIWNLGNNSAMIYYYRVARILKMQVRLRYDTDYGKCKMMDGVVSVNDIEKTMRLLRDELGYQLLVDSPEIKVFALPEPVEESTLDAWKHTREELYKRFNAQNMPKVTYPKIHECAVDLQVKVVNRLKRVSPISYYAYGHLGAEITEWLVYNVIATMNGRKDPEEFLTEALEQLGHFTDWLVMVERFELFDIESIMRVSVAKDSLVGEIKLQIEINKEKERARLERQEARLKAKEAEEAEKAEAEKAGAEKAEEAEKAEAEKAEAEKAEAEKVEAVEKKGAKAKKDE